MTCRALPMMGPWQPSWWLHREAPATCYLGLRSTRMTESPLKNILLMKRSLFTGLAPF